MQGASWVTENPGGPQGQPAAHLRGRPVGVPPWIRRPRGAAIRVRSDRQRGTPRNTQNLKATIDAGPAHAVRRSDPRRCDRRGGSRYRCAATRSECPT